jgi:hypothetical protein
MPSSTSTFTTSKAKPESTGPRLRVTDQDTPSKLSAKKDGNEHDIFFWTYTEEPHRTRRQAIIKAHPEVVQLILLNMIATKITNPGHEALRARTIDQVLRDGSRLTSSTMRIPFTKYTIYIMAILLDCLYNRCYRKPESLPGYS